MNGCCAADAEDSMWRSPVSSINLVQLNRTITRQYCVHADCSGSQGPGFSAAYRLLLHPRFPLAFVTVQFQYVCLFCNLGVSRRS